MSDDHLPNLISSAFAAARAPAADAIAATPQDDGIVEYFRGTTWRGHAVGDLRHHAAALSFFTGPAFRYWLPAFMLASLADPAAADVIPESIASAVRDPARRAALSADERRAVAAFLDAFARRSGEPFAATADAMRSLTVRRVTVLADPAVSGVERIYVDAFPASELKPLAWVRSLPGRADYHLAVAERVDVVGFAVLWVPAVAADAALLEYMAVADGDRGGGVGGTLFAGAVRAAGRPVLIEVKDGDPQAERRRAFYRRHGCRLVVGLDYLLPLPGAPPMGLMVGGVDAVSRVQLSRWLTTVYADVYGQRRDDPRLATMLAGIADGQVTLA